MAIREFLSQRLYLIISIITILTFFLPTMQFFEFSKTGGAPNWVFVSLLYIIKPGSFELTFDFATGTSYWYFLVVPFVIIFPGIILMVLAGIYTENRKVQKIFPAIGLSLILYAVVLSSMAMLRDAGGGIPFFYLETGSSIIISFVSVSTYLTYVACTIGGYKYLFSHE